MKRFQKWENFPLLFVQIVIVSGHFPLTTAIYSWRKPQSSRQNCWLPAPFDNPEMMQFNANLLFLICYTELT